MTWLWVVQMANYLLPIIVIPFVTRALGVTAFGEVSYAQNIAIYLALLVNFGFDYSATQDVALNINNPSALRTIFRTVVGVRFTLFVLSLLLFLIVYLSINPAQQSFHLYLWAAIYNLGYVLFPNWYFQGTERMRSMSLINLAVKAMGAILVILLVKQADDAELYLFLLAIVFVLVGCVTFIYVSWQLKKANDKFFFDKALAKSVVKKAFPIFINNVANSLYWVAGVTIIGYYMLKSDVGIYAGSQKLIQACIMLSCMPFSVSIFPKLSRMFASENADAAWKYYNRILFIGIAFGVLMAIGIFVFAPLAVNLLLGSEFAGSIVQVRQMCFLPLLVMIGTLLTVEGLYALQMQQYAPLIGIVAGLSSIVLTFITVPKIATTGAIVGWYAAQIVEITIVGIILYSKKLKLLNKE